MLLIGLMSGTSVDGIDSALVEITGEPDTLKWQLIAFHCHAWEPALRAEILSVCHASAPLQKVVALHFRCGEVFAEAARTLAEQAGVPLSQVDAIASHGQTIWHQPKPFLIAGVPVTGTLQIGEPSTIAARTGCLVVADFRPADMAVGGQGAPLVPFIDYLLFHSATEGRAVQNIGGIANVTYLPKTGGASAVFAFDTGPGNMVLDALTERVTGGVHRYDMGGEFALRGHVCAPLLEEALQHPFFRLAPPKSTGREEFGQAFAQRFYQQAQTLSLSSKDTLATAAQLTVESIARGYEAWILPKGELQRVILGGGGVHNRALCEGLAKRLPQIAFQAHTDFGLPDDAKEALAFAVLGYETLHLRPSNMPSSTGANSPAILGKICYPPPVKSS